MKLNGKQNDRTLHAIEAEDGNGCYLRMAERVKNVLGGRQYRWEAQVIELSEDELSRLIEWARKRGSR
jgi:hypothetical protein